MEILLLILKIIGIVLLVLLLLFLTMILSVIFIPVRYRIKGRAASPDEIEADMMISWILHLIHGRIWVSGSDIRYKIRIAGIPLPVGKEKKPRKKRKKSKLPEKQSEENRELEEDIKVDLKVDSEKRNTYQEEKKETLTVRESRAEPPEKQERLPDYSVRKKKKRKKSRHGIIWFWNECKAWILQLKQTIAGLKDKTTTWKEQLGNIKNIILEETNKNAVICLFREFKYIMKHFLPRKVFGTLQFGMEDPAITGQILGIASIFPFWHRYQVSLEPDFTAESFFVKGDIEMKGRVRALHMLRSGIRLIKDKNIRKLINQIRK